MIKINVPRELLGSKIVSNKGKVIIKNEVTLQEFEIIKDSYPNIQEVKEKKPKESIEDIKE